MVEWQCAGCVMDRLGAERRPFLQYDPGLGDDGQQLGARRFAALACCENKCVRGTDLVGNAAVVELELTEHITNGLGQALDLQDCDNEAILRERQTNSSE